MSSGEKKEKKLRENQNPLTAPPSRMVIQTPKGPLPVPPKYQMLVRHLGKAQQTLDTVNDYLKSANALIAGLIRLDQLEEEAIRKALPSEST